MQRLKSMSKLLHLFLIIAKKDDIVSLRVYRYNDRYNFLSFASNYNILKLYSAYSKFYKTARVLFKNNR